MLEVLGGDPSIGPILFDLHQHYPMCDTILKWLIKNKYTGKDLTLWFRNFHNSSPLGMFSYILKCVEKDKSKKLILGKDWV